MTLPTTGKFILQSWAGRSEHRFEVVKATPKGYRVRLLDDAMSKGKAGDVIWIPRIIARFEPEDFFGMEVE